jgi:hypothetical protein
LFFPEDGLSVFTWIAFAVMIGGLALSDAGIRQGLRERAGKAAEPGD